MSTETQGTALQMREQNAMATIGHGSTLSLAIERGIDPATLGKLMDLQERWEANQARKFFTDAMAGFKAECPAVISKDRKADFGAGKAKYSYATTGAIVTAITPSLSKFGLSISWETKQDTRLVTVTCHVTHSGGHRESATLTGPHDESGGKNPIQTLGSSVHYLQRYTLVSVLGLATADMDDADNTPPKKPTGGSPLEQEKATKPQGQTVTGIIDDVVLINSKPDAAKKWVKWGIKIGSETYGTFDKTIGETAISCKGLDVVLTYTDDGKYKTAVSVELEKPVDLPL